jgi:hypothetical protein
MCGTWCALVPRCSLFPVSVYRRGRVCGMLACSPASEVSRRYANGSITPDAFSRWHPLRDVGGSLNEATRMVGGLRVHRYLKAAGSEWLGTPHPLFNDSHGRAVLLLAKRRVRSIDFLGLASRFADSLVLLSWWLGLPPLNITCVTNKRPPWEAEHKLLTLSDAGRSAVLARNSLDMELYTEAVRLWGLRWASMRALAPERAASDRYSCHPITSAAQCQSVRFHSPLLGALSKCSTHCMAVASMLEAHPLNSSSLIRQLNSSSVLFHGGAAERQDNGTSPQAHPGHGAHNASVGIRSYARGFRSGGRPNGSRLHSSIVVACGLFGAALIVVCVSQSATGGSSSLHHPRSRFRRFALSKAKGQTR